ncbi:hypothetical protein TNIN_82761 [Trichonephila inaurata madagascariensis]|uniref:Uncharacterized protein n=1 Tax=Trichonephila inaurata madagascariensis TaxID=2747483 RepID=A0A8X7CPH4_9ARAC|nr:hypothetical protein TNIN_82761 [Trichonephila inaurata madagascariensis]
MDNACLHTFFEYGNLQFLDYVYSSLQAKGSYSKNRLHMIDFKLVIAEILIKTEVSEETVKERPQRKKNQQIVPLPVNAVWYD